MYIVWYSLYEWDPIVLSVTGGGGVECSIPLLCEELQLTV